MKHMTSKPGLSLAAMGLAHAPFRSAVVVGRECDLARGAGFVAGMAAASAITPDYRMWTPTAVLEAVPV